MILVREAQRMQLGGEAERVVYLLQQRDRVIDQLEPPLQRAIDAGKLKALPARPVAHMIMGNIKGYLMAAPIGSCLDATPEETKRPSPEEAAEFLATMLFDGLLA